MKSLSAILLCALISVASFSGCATQTRDSEARASEQTLQLIDGTASHTLHATVGSSFFIEIKGNPTTGFEWIYRPETPGKVKLIEQSFTPAPNPDGAAGVGGTYSFEFIPTEPGPAVLNFDYLRAWEKVPPAKIKTVRLQITGK